MLVDDEWPLSARATCTGTLSSETGELNASFSHARSVRAMRVALFQEHLGADTTEVDDVEALRLFRRIARANRRRHVRNDPRWRAIAFALDAASYGLAPQF